MFDLTVYLTQRVPVSLQVAIREERRREKKNYSYKVWNPFLFFLVAEAAYVLHETTEDISVQSLHTTLWSKSHARAVKCEGGACIVFFCLTPFWVVCARPVKAAWCKGIFMDFIYF